MGRNGEAGEARRFLGTHEAARMLSVDAGTVIRWADAGRIPAFRTPGGHRRMLWEDVQRFAREHGWPPSAPPRTDGVRGADL